MIPTSKSDGFHLIFVVLFCIAFAIRLYYHYKAKIWQGDSTPEGGLSLFFRTCVGLPVILLIIVYLFWPRVLKWADVPVPVVWRWIGAGIFAASLPLLIWIQHSLGSNYSPQLRIRSEHNLVSSGPYRYVRHPMYTTSLIIYTGMGLLSANWFIGGVNVVATLVLMIFRTPREEGMLTQAFGDKYRQYSESTGKFLPRLRFAGRENRSAA